MLPERLSILKKENQGGRFILFNSPEHDNIGDHLISVAEVEFLKKYFSNQEVIEVTDKEFHWHHRAIRKYIKKEDVLLVTGGGFLGSLWLYHGEYHIRRIIKDYPDNKIVIMPQTAFFEETCRGQWEKKQTRKIYNQHKDLTICLREKQSLETMQQIMESHVSLVLAPDMVLSLPHHSYSQTRDGVLLCMRNDKECVLSEEEKDDIKQILQDLKLAYSTTLMHSGNCVGVEGRDDEIHKKMSEIAKAQLVITDTLHCMIVCAITGTPCIAFNNISGKVKNVYEWINTLPYIMCLDKPEQMKEKICSLLEQGPQKYEKELLEEYYANLAKEIGK